jgi:hypothetical protein
MTGRGFGRLAWVVAVGAIASCAGNVGSDGSRGNSGDPGAAPPGGSASTGGASGGPSNPAPGNVEPPPATSPPGSGGSSAGTGGAPGGGTSGGNGAGGAAGSADAGAIVTPDASANQDAPGAPVPSCRLTLVPLSPQRLDNLPAGEGFKLRVEARVMVTGLTLPAKPTWRWQVMHAGREVPTVVHDGDPAVREFATDLAGRYDILAEILETTNPPCRSSAVAVAVALNQRVAEFRIRATPPAVHGLAAREQDVVVTAGTARINTIELGRGRSIEVAARDESGIALRSYYVRVTAHTSTDRFESYIVSSRAETFQARVDSSGLLDERYDVMIVPDSPVGNVLPPAQLFTALTASWFPTANFTLDGGVAIGGSTLVGDAPVVGARVRLSAGLLPSTVGVTDAQGSFALRARSGQFEVRVVPPADSGLPDALLPESSGIAVTNTPQQVSLRYTLLPTAQLDLRVLTPEGTVPGKPVEVILETIEDALPDVGTFTLASGATTTAIGSVRSIRSSSAGAIRWNKLPRARYRATVVPPEDLPGSAAITVVEFPLEAEVVTQTVTLARRSRILGRLVPPEASRDLTVRGLDMGEDGVRRAVTAAVDADGRYQLPVDPGRVYRLFVEPAPGRKIPRIPLVPVRARVTDVTDEQRLPAGLPVSGRVLDTTTGVADVQGLAGVVIQIFCLGSAPDCIDRSSPDISNTPPIDETVSGADGSYLLHVPDPGLSAP